MFRSENVDFLRGQLNRFSIPMFIAQLDPNQNEFQILALNEHHERETGMAMTAASGKALSMLLPDDQARAVSARYHRCINQSAPLRYREELNLPRGRMIWDTTLHHFITRGRRHRVVGSAILVERITRDQRDTLAFEDIRYFSTTSSCQLAQIVRVLEAIEGGALDPSLLQGSAGMLAGLCRSIDSTMQDLRDIAERRLLAEAPVATPLLGPSGPAPEFDELDKAMATLTALAETLTVPLPADGSPIHARTAQR